jgi:DNA-binding HxlR family transcriptional regulator
MVRRSQAQMLFEVFEALYSSPMKITRLMYKTNINSGVLADLVRILVNNGYVQVPYFVEKHPLSMKKPRKKPKYPTSFGYPYTLTPQGRAFFERVAPVMKEFQTLVNVVDAQTCALEAQRYSVILQKGSAMQ